jgi:hypothetical protein
MTEFEQKIALGIISFFCIIWGVWFYFIREQDH